MSILKSSAENLTLNADGANNDVIIQSNGSTKAIVTAEGTLGIGTTTPTQKLDVSGHLLFGNGRSNSAEKHGRFTAINYNTAVNPMCVIYANGASSGNFVRFGGGTDSVSPVTSFQFFTATGTPANGEGTKRATLDSDGLKFGTDTAAANALDDYEEGTWTAGFAFGGNAVSMTYDANSGWYTKTGNVVVASCNLDLSNKGSSTGNASITGLPFTSSGHYGCAWGYNLYITHSGSFIGRNESSAIIDLNQVNDSGASTSLTNSNFQNNSRCVVTLTYRV